MTRRLDPQKEKAELRAYLPRIEAHIAWLRGGPKPKGWPPRELRGRNQRTDAQQLERALWLRNKCRQRLAWLEMEYGK